MAKKRKPRNKGRVQSDRSEAQKRYLRKHYAEQAELDQDDQWSANGTNRLTYFENINPEHADVLEDQHREEGFPF